MRKAPPAFETLLICLFVGIAGADAPNAEPAETVPRKTSPSKTAATQQAITTRRLSIDVKDVPLLDVLEMLTSRAGVGLAVDGRVTSETLAKPLSLNLRQGSVYAVLHWVFRKRDLAWAVDGEEVVVGPADTMKDRITTEQKKFVRRVEKAWRKKAEPKLDESRLTLNMAGVPLVRLVDLVAERAGLNVVWEKGAEAHRGRATTLKVSDAAVRDILDSLTKQAKLQWSLEAEAIVISPTEP